MSRVHSVSLFTCALITTAALAGQLASAQTNSQPNPYRTIENYFTLPDGRKLGGTAGIETDRDGRSIWAFERCGGDTCEGSRVAPLLKFDASGTLMKAIGADMFVVPHGLHVDRDGNVWVTDGQGATGKGQQVFKFSPEGKVLMTLGKPGVAGEGPDTFNRPSDVLVGPNGDVFVADGHGGDTNARIVKFSKTGTFIKAWGKKGSGRGEFDTPHTLAMDSQGRLFVGDRGNNRIQIFDQQGTFLDEWKQFGRPSGIYIEEGNQDRKRQGRPSHGLYPRSRR
jgi:streptogramin lyase